jgi:penicillin-binding protein 1B
MITPTPISTLRRDLSDMTPARRRAVIAALAASCLIFLAGFFAAVTVWKLVRQFPRAPFKQPTRLYAQVPHLAPGQRLTADEIAAQLADEGYREATPGLPLRRGTWRRAGDRIEVHLRRFPTPDGMAGGAPVAIEVRGGRVARLAVAGRPARDVTLEPPLLASFYGPEVDERRPVSVDEVPDTIVKAMLAAEDDGFYIHPGVSPSGIARALWANLRGGSVQQGGSTVTQQLVKTLYLSRERTLERKAKEAVIAVILELRYSKRQILEAYLNEIYWGRSGPANVVGLGAAARAYFSKDADELSLSEAATLAAMIRGPSEYSPLEHPDRALVRRNWVLQRMGELGWLTPERVRSAQAAPLVTDPQTVEVHPFAPYFTKVAEAEARERFDLDELADEGYALFSTVRWRDQRQAEAAVTRELSTLEKGWEKKHRGEDPLQAALISVDPRDGAIRAWVGGRDWSASQFDRVTQAKRQVGSAFKPVIYAAAFREAVATPATLLKDSPIVVRVGNDRWQPQNYDRGFRGWVTVRSALEQSLNIPAVRLSLQVGLGRVADLAHEMGFEGDIEARPSLALGAFEVTPYEMAEVYSTFASGGLRPSLHGIAAVRDRFGEEILGDDLPTPRRVLPPQSVYLVTSILQGVVDHGTGAGLRSQGLSDPLAGKTGTTNDRRDSWFAGYAPDRVTVVWVGYDNNARTRLSGSRAALPIWGRFMAAVRPPAGYADFAPPSGMQRVTIDPTTGQLATAYCPYRTTELLPEWQVPTEVCRRHQPGGSGETWADMNLNGAPLDPATGQPVAGVRWDPYGLEDPVSGDGAMPASLEDAPFGPPGDDGIVEPTIPARTFPPHPVDVGETPVEGAVSTDGSILIRPSREETPPVKVEGVKPPDDLEVTPPVEETPPPP